MYKLKMDQKYLVGIDKIDEQHSHILLLIEKAMEGIKKNEKIDECMEGLIAEAKRYAENHLKYEEMLMQEFFYENIEKHFEEHEKFRMRIDMLDEKANLNIDDLKGMAIFFRNWFLNHIAVFDKELAQVINQNKMLELKKILSDNFVPAYVQIGDTEIPVLVLGQSPILNSDDKVSFRLVHDDKRSEFYDSTREVFVNSFLGSRPNRSEKKQVYLPIPSLMVKSADGFPFDLFVLENDTTASNSNLNQNLNQNQKQNYKKIHNGLEVFEFWKVNQYLMNGVTSFFVQEEDFERAVEMYFPASSGTKRQEDAIYYQENDLIGVGSEALPEGLKKLGVTYDAYLRCNNAIKHLLMRVRDTKEIVNYLSWLFSDDKSYSFKQNNFLAYIGTEFILKYKSEKIEETIEQWVFSSFLHDLAIRDDEQLKIRGDWELQFANLSAKQKEVVLDHPQLAVKIIDTCTKVPLGARTLILQHHGSKIGRGFPRDYYSSFNPSTMEFILLEDFIFNYVVNHRSVQVILKDFVKQFANNRYSPIIERFFNVFGFENESEN